HAGRWRPSSRGPPARPRRACRPRFVARTRRSGARRRSCPGPPVSAAVPGRAAPLVECITPAPPRQEGLTAPVRPEAGTAFAQLPLSEVRPRRRNYHGEPHDRTGACLGTAGGDGAQTGPAGAAAERADAEAGGEWAGGTGTRRGLPAERPARTQ